MTRTAARLMPLLLTTLLLTACGDTSDTNASTTTVVGTSSTVDVTTSLATTTTSGATTSSTSSPESPMGEVLVVGDWGSGSEPQGAVAGAMQRYSEENEITAILTTGDNFYSDDADFLMQPYFWVEEAGIDWWITWGNHDVETDARIDIVNETFDDPPRWGVYSWDDMNVIVLDSNQVTSLDQAAFLLSTLAEGDNPTIVVLHHPPFSCAHHGATAELSKEVVEVFDDDVALVLSGHDHSYQRFEHGGVSYVVTGGGGRDLYEIDECPTNHPELIAGAELHHFLALTRIEQATVKVTAIDVNGATIDEFEIDLG